MSRTFFAAGSVGFSAHPIFQPAEHFLAFSLEADDLAVFVEAGPHIEEAGELVAVHLVGGQFVSGMGDPDPAGAVDGRHIVFLDALEIVAEDHIDEGGLAGLDARADFRDIVGRVVAAAGVLDRGISEGGLENDFGKLAVVGPVFAAVQAICSPFVGGVEDVADGDGVGGLFHFG